MNRVGRDSLSVIIDKLPLMNRVVRWFKGDEMNIDNHLFKLHYQASTLVIIVGFLVISEKNYLDIQAKSILCHSEKSLSEYAKTYCWIHGTSYVRKALQGKATGCFIDQTQIESEEDAPVTAYYLWLPYLLTICFILARLPRSAWKRFFENGLIRHILKGKTEQSQGNNRMNQSQVNNIKKSSEIAENFLHYQPKYKKYHIWFCLCELLNIGCVILSMAFCHWLLNYQFFFYGLKVLNYLGTVKRVNYLGQYITHDPMCELFPTEVACTLRYGATTGALDRSNFLCILGNNLFNQKYFFVLWLWWAFLLFASCIGIVYRAARIVIPSFSRVMLMRKVPGPQLDSVELYSSADYFVLDMMVQNMEDRQMEQVLDEIEKKMKKRNLEKSSELSQSLPSIIIEEPKKCSAGSESSSGFGSDKGEPVKETKQSPSSPVLRESYMPMRVIMRENYSQKLEGSSKCESITSEGTSISDFSDVTLPSAFRSGHTEV